MGIICVNLVDGTVVVGKQVGIEGTVLSDVLLISTSTSLSGLGTQVYLTKYNIFGDEAEMIFNPNLIITKYKASKYIRSFYRQYLEKARTKGTSNTLTSDTETNGPTLLSEFESAFKKVDIDDLRNNTKRLINEDDDIDEDDEEDFDEDDDDFDEQDK